MGAGSRGPPALKNRVVSYLSVSRLTVACLYALQLHSVPLHFQPPLVIPKPRHNQLISVPTAGKLAVALGITPGKPFAVSCVALAVMLGIARSRGPVRLGVLLASVESVPITLLHFAIIVPAVVITI